MKRKKLTKKELLFCYYFSRLFNAREAAAMSGYIHPEKSGYKLFMREDIRKNIDKQESLSVSGDEVISGLRRLSFGCIADSLKLLLNENGENLSVDEMDLFNIAEIKKPKGGGLEIKFFDRLKALEKLGELCSDNSGNTATPFFDAIEKGAAAIHAEHSDD